MLNPRLTPQNSGCRGARGDEEEALVLWEELLQIDPSNAVAQHEKGLILSRTNRLDEGIASLKAACDNDPSNVVVANNLGVMLFKGMGTDLDRDEALKFLNTAAKTFTNAHAVHNLKLLEVIGSTVKKGDRRKSWDFENAACDDVEVRFVEDRFNQCRSDLVFSTKYFLHR